MLRMMLAAVVLGGGTSLSAGMIDFEAVPGQLFPYDKMEIGDQFKDTEGVTFRLKGTSALPVLEATGADADGSDVYIYNVAQQRDAVAPGQPSIGNFMLHHDGVNNDGDPLPDLIIEFGKPQAFVSGQVMDVDTWNAQSLQLEGWEVTAFSGTTAVGFIDIYPEKYGFGLVDGEDGIASQFAFDFETAQITSIEIAYVGNVINPGYAFDNFVFSTQPIPEPGSMALLALCGMGGLGYRKRKQRLTKV